MYISKIFYLGNIFKFQQYTASILKRYSNKTQQYINYLNQSYWPHLLEPTRYLKNFPMQLRNSLDDRFINLREVFYDFQTTVRFSTSNSNNEIFANHLKCYQFLGQLQQHFIAQKVQHLYQFIHSIFSLIFTMIRQGPSSHVQGLGSVGGGRNNSGRNARNLNNNNYNNSNQNDKISSQDISVQTQPSQFDNVKIKGKNIDENQLNHHRKKRSCMEIQIFQKDIAEMDFRQRRRILKKMRDAIQQQQQNQQKDNQQNNFLKQFRPNIQKIQYSKSDQNIKSAIDKFKQSDISTHIFLKHFVNEDYEDMKDIKEPAELLNNQQIQKMAKMVHKYRKFKMMQRMKFKLFNHVIQEIIYPTLVSSYEDYSISVSEINDNANGKNTQKNKRNRQKMSGNSYEQIEEEHEQQQFEKSLKIIERSSNLNPKITKSAFQQQFNKLKRNKFPSLLLKPGQELNPISQQKSQSSINSSKSSKSQKNGGLNVLQKNKINKLRKSLSRNGLQNRLSLLRRDSSVKNNRYSSSSLIQSAKQSLQKKASLNSTVYNNNQDIFSSQFAHNNNPLQSSVNLQQSFQNEQKLSQNMKIVKAKSKQKSRRSRSSIRMSQKENNEQIIQLSKKNNIRDSQQISGMKAKVTQRQKDKYLQPFHKKSTNKLRKRGGSSYLQV